MDLAPSPCFRSWARAITFPGMLGMGGALVCCEALVRNDVYQCTTNDDCVGRGGPFQGTSCVGRVCVASDAAPMSTDAGALDPKWGCIGKIPYNPPSETEHVNLRVRFVALLSEQNLPFLHVQACKSLDVLCSAPIADIYTDANGYGNLSVPRYFSGYLYVRSPPEDAGVDGGATTDKLLPSIILQPPPSVDDDPDASIPLNISAHLGSASDFNQILTLIGKTADRELGHLLGLAIDCTGAPAAGVSLHADLVDTKTVPYYVENGTPSTTATQTGPRGEAGYMNLPAGSVKITASVPSLGKNMGASTVLIRPGHATYAPFGPTP